MRPAFDRVQRRHPIFGLPIAIVYKFVDDQGSYLAALITYYGFLSLFPLLLLASSILGFVLHGNAHLQHDVLKSAVGQFPVVGKQLQTNVRGYQGSGVALAIGILTSLYGGLGVAQAGQNAMNTVWEVPRNERPNPLMSRVRSLLALGTLGLGVIATTGLSGVTAAIHFGAVTRILSFVLSLLLNVGLFLAAFRVLTDRDISFRDIVVGATAAAVAWQLLQSVGIYVLAHHLRGASEIYGVFGAVLGLIAWIHIEALMVVMCAELNVVVRHRLWPRALLTPFTDDVDLTSADERAYTAYAKAQRNKGFEKIDVEFEERERQRRRDERGELAPEDGRTPKAP